MFTQDGIVSKTKLYQLKQFCKQYIDILYNTQ
jgi:hypothetical protein